MIIPNNLSSFPRFLQVIGILKRVASVSFLHLIDAHAPEFIQLIPADIAGGCDHIHGNGLLHGLLEQDPADAVTAFVDDTLQGGYDDSGHVVPCSLRCQVADVEKHCLFDEFALAGAVVRLEPLPYFFQGGFPDPEGKFPLPLFAFVFVFQYVKNLLILSRTTA